jgi:hypothetical protein
VAVPMPGVDILSYTVEGHMGEHGCACDISFVFSGLTLLGVALPQTRLKGKNGACARLLG